MPNQRHLTAIEDAAVHESGWVALPGTSVEVLRLPLIDLRLALPSGMPLFARLDYRSALAWCERNGCRLIDKLELDACCVRCCCRTQLSARRHRGGPVNRIKPGMDGCAPA
jgi:hypothetical protein